MLTHAFIIFTSLLSALLFSQVPGFMQQYNQRLGGAIDELTRIVSRFDDDARRSGHDRSAAIQLMAKNPERLVRDQAVRMDENVARLQRLRDQQETFRHAGSFFRLASFVANYDSPLAKRTYQAYEPSLPLTLEGTVFAVSGFFGPYFLMFAMAEALRRRRRLTA